MAREGRAIGSRLLAVASLLLLLLVFAATRCEARAARRLQSKGGSGSNPLLDALFKLNFIRAVEPPPRLPPPAAAGGDAASLADAGSSNAPFCVNPPDAPPSTYTSPFGSTPSTPSVPDQPLPQPPPLPPVAPVPPSFEPSPPDNGGGTPTPGQGGQGGGQGGGGQGQEGPPASATPNPPPLFGPSTPAGMAPPSPIVVVPSPPDFGPGGSGSGGGGPFQPPIVYPPPLAPPLLPGAGKPVWCVAKPTVPDPIIQEAMDYACGSGAECESIQPSGACYHPNTVLAHASFAFNSYWQQTKSAGGTCDFGGTAAMVTRDPSYDKCKFDLF